MKFYVGVEIAREQSTELIVEVEAETLEAAERAALNYLRRERKVIDQALRDNYALEWQTDGAPYVSGIGGEQDYNAHQDWWKPDVVVPSTGTGAAPVKE